MNEKSSIQEFFANLKPAKFYEWKLHSPFFESITTKDDESSNFKNLQHPLRNRKN